MIGITDTDDFSTGKCWVQRFGGSIAFQVKFSIVVTISSCWITVVKTPHPNGVAIAATVSIGGTGYQVGDVLSPSGNITLTVNRSTATQTLLVTSGDVTHQVYITSLSATLEAFQKFDTQQLTSSTSSLAVTFGEGFLVSPKIAVTAQNMASGDFYEISSVSSTGFTITFKNSSGTIVARTFDYIARGF